MGNLKEFMRRIPKTWLVPVCLLFVLTLVGYEHKRKWRECVLFANVIANDFEYFESVLLVIIVVPAGYYTGLVPHLFCRRKILQYEINYQYATHILKRLILDVDDVDRKFLKCFNCTEDVPINTVEHVHHEISKAIDVFHFDSRRLQGNIGNPITLDELNTIVHADAELFAKSPLKNLCVKNVFETIRLLNKR